MEKRPSKDLAEILTSRNISGKYDAIIERARNNGYHDHKFHKIPGHPEYGECDCPKIKLYQDLLQFPELQDIREQVLDGFFDDPADAEDIQEMRQDLLMDGAPSVMFEILGFEIPTQEERARYKKSYFE